MKHKFAEIVVTGLLATAGFAQAGSTFPSAAAEGSEYSVNTPLVATPAGLTGAVAGFPSAGQEGSESPSQRIQATTTRQATAPRHLERTYAGGQGSVFPIAAMEQSPAVVFC